MNKKILKEIGADDLGRAILEHYMNENGGKLVFDMRTVVLTLASLDIANDLTDNKAIKKRNKRLYNKFAKLFASLGE